MPTPILIHNNNNHNSAAWIINIELVMCKPEHLKAFRLIAKINSSHASDRFHQRFRSSITGRNTINDLIESKGKLDKKKKKRSPLSYVFPVCMTTRNHFTGPFCETAGDGTARSLSAGLLLPLHASASPAALRIVAKRPNFTFPLNPTSVGKSGLREQLRMCHLLHSFLFLFPSLNPSKCVRYSRLLQNSCGKTTCHTPLFHFRGKKL